MKALRLAVVGFGPAASSVIKPYFNHPGIALLACADGDPSARERFETAVDGGRAFASLAELLAAQEVDVIYIATPTRTHEEITLTALRHGIHVLVEKPISDSLESAQRMIDEAERHGLTLMVNHKRSADRGIVIMRSMIRSGMFGPVRSVNRWFHADWFYRPRAFSERDPRFGGVVLRQGAHEFDIARALVGSPPTRLMGWVGDFDPHEAGEGAYQAWVSCADGSVITSLYGGYDRFRYEEFIDGPLPGELIGASRRYFHQTKQSSGSQPSLDLRYEARGLREKISPTGMYGFTFVICEGGEFRTVPYGKVWLYDSVGRREVSLAGIAGSGLIVEEMYRAVTQQRRPFHDGRWGLACLELCLAVRRAGREGGCITLVHQALDRDNPLASELYDGEFVIQSRDE